MVTSSWGGNGSGPTLAGASLGAGRGAGTGWAAAHALNSTTPMQCALLTLSWYHARPLHASTQLWALGWLCVACAGTAPETDWAGASGAPRNLSQPTKQAPPQPWAGFRDAMARPVAAPGARRSHGHADGRYTLEVRVGPDSAQRAYESWTAGSQMPIEASLLATHHDQRRGRAGPIYAMRKRPGAWDFAVLDEAGLRQKAPVELCARCHAEAHSDQIFGPPKHEGPAPGE